MVRLLASGLALGLSIAIPLGPVSIEQIRQGLVRGFWPAFAVSFGAVTGDTVFFSLVAFGLAPVIFRYPMLKATLWLAGTIFLIHLGFGSIRKVRVIDLNSTGINNVGSRRAAYFSGLYLQITNPMGFVLWSSVGTAVFASVGLSMQANFRLQVLPVYLGVIIGILGWGFMLSLLVSWGRRFVSEEILVRINRFCGLVLLGFAFYFGWQFIKSIVGLGKLG
ncbi:MAG TPA: LysE family transporter [bacterium]|jgi:threonine/homoserine/homoserine lactone efflux protein|nr:LysE family transporter [bacterium]